MSEAERIAAIVLAAGASTRFGSPKQLARIGGRTMLELVIQVARDASLHPIIAVIPPDLRAPADVHAVVNPDPAAGLSRSLQIAIAAVPVDVAAAVVLLGDQPTLHASVVRRLVGHRTDRPIVAARAEGRIGPPLLIRRSAFDLADHAVGDEGLRSILAARPDLVEPVEVASHAPDVDRPGDLDTLRSTRA